MSIAAFQIWAVSITSTTPLISVSSSISSLTFLQLTWIPILARKLKPGKKLCGTTFLVCLLLTLRQLCPFTKCSALSLMVTCLAPFKCWLCSNWLECCDCKESLPTWIQLKTLSKVCNLSKLQYILFCSFILLHASGFPWRSRMKSGSQAKQNYLENLEQICILILHPSDSWLFVCIPQSWHFAAMTSYR